MTKVILVVENMKIITFVIYFMLDHIFDLNNAKFTNSMKFII